jgi:myo-inositol 2-dehydrogenase/D-chiro-inositol 1-dehydrogenase
MSVVKIGIVGLGRLGKRHAANLRFRVQGADLKAACSIVPEELEWARTELGITETYTDYDEMLNEAKLDAVFLVSSSSMHAEQSMRALSRGLHVFTEKPMGVNLEECKKVEKVVGDHGEQVFFVGFVRRFDPSYSYAKKLIDEGAIGEPFLVRSQTVDLDEYAEFQVDFVPSSGGIFLDCNVHDIDLARWFLGSEVKTVYSKGGSYVHKAFEEVNDADNTIVLTTFEDGKMAVIAASRTAFHGHDTHTEITGSKGILKIGMTPAKNRVEIFDVHGARQECVNDFFERFQEGFLIEAQEFVDCILEGRKPIVSAKDGTKATEVGFAMTDSFKQGREIVLE